MRPVLVVERDSSQRERLLQALYEAGFEVHGAHGADDALGVLGSVRRPWAIVASVSSAEPDGWVLTEALSAFPVSDDRYRVLLLSSHERGEELRDRRFVSAVLRTPVSTNVVVSQLRAR